jgi:hypothetical protein
MLVEKNDHFKEAFTSAVKSWTNEDSAVKVIIGNML